MRLWIQKSLACVPSAAALGLLVETTAVASSEPLTFHLPATLSTAAEDRPQLQSGEKAQTKTPSTLWGMGQWCGYGGSWVMVSAEDNTTSVSQNLRS